MSPALFRRYERSVDGEGWGRIASRLDCRQMPTPFWDEGLEHFSWVRYSRYKFAWTGDSLERWVTAHDKRELHDNGYVQRDYLCPPGTFLLGHEQAVFDRSAATVVGEVELLEGGV